MLARLQMIWAAVRDSLWFIPAALTLTGAVLAFALVQVDSAYNLTALEGGHFIIGGSVDGAREVLSTIAGSLITVTGVVFSVTIVALQLASSQFTPRILRNFTADRSNQLVLGVFIATFTYTLLVLRVVRSTDQGREFVPQLSVSVAIVLALVSIGFLIHFIHHAARSIQASVILEFVAAEAVKQVQKLFPEEIGEPEESPLRPEIQVPTSKPELVAAEAEGYLDVVDGQSLFAVGEKQHLLIRMAQPVGAFIVEGQALAHVWSDEPLGDEACQKIRRAFVIGPERTPEQDVEFYLIEILDMAVKALSPSVNDPTTAMHCIDRLTQILLALGKRRPPAPMRTQRGQVHFLALPLTFEGALKLAFEQIVHFGRSNPAIINKLRRSLGLLNELLPAQRQQALNAFRAQMDECTDSP